MKMTDELWHELGFKRAYNPVELPSLRILKGEFWKTSYGDYGVYFSADQEWTLLRVLRDMIEAASKSKGEE